MMPLLYCTDFILIITLSGVIYKIRKRARSSCWRSCSRRYHSNQHYKNTYYYRNMPTNILILSDMEFDRCVLTDDRCSPSKKLFAKIQQKYEACGYKLPRLVFWNIMSRTGTIPLRENELGVALVSGFSPTIINMVLSDALDPYQCLLEQLNSHRYDLVETAFKDGLHK